MRDWSRSRPRPRRRGVNFSLSHSFFFKTLEKTARKRSKMVIIACFSSDSEGDATKLREFQRMQRMHRQHTEDTENTINQSSGGFSLINIQWASIIVCALLFLSVMVCCLIPTKNIRRTKSRHTQLLDVLRRSQVGLSLTQSQTPGFPDQCRQSPLQHNQPLPLKSCCALPLGGRPCPRPTNFQPLPSMGFLSCLSPSSLRLSTMEDISPSASVGFLGLLAAGGIPNILSAVKSPSHTRHGHSQHS